MEERSSTRVYALHPSLWPLTAGRQKGQRAARGRAREGAGRGLGSNSVKESEVERKEDFDDEDEEEHPGLTDDRDSSCHPFPAPRWL